MAIIKSYTDLEQSKVLAEILPLESADMFYKAGNDTQPTFRLHSYGHIMSNDDVPCWSLASLLGVIKMYGLIDLRFLSSTFDGRGEHLTNVWCCTFDNINTVSFDFYADNPIDACYEVILKLKEKKLL